MGGKPSTITRSGSPPVCMSMVEIFSQCEGGCQIMTHFGVRPPAVALLQRYLNYVDDAAALCWRICPFTERRQAVALQSDSVKTPTSESSAADYSLPQHHRFATANRKPPCRSCS